MTVVLLMLFAVVQAQNLYEISHGDDLNSLFHSIGEKRTRESNLQCRIDPLRAPQAAQPNFVRRSQSPRSVNTLAA